MFEKLLYTIFLFLPKDALTAAFGRFAKIQKPRWLAQISIKVFIHLYKISTTEAAASIESYRSLQDFFLRTLLPMARPIGAGVVAPADGRIRMAGQISTDLVYLIKGKKYSLEKLIGSENAEQFRQGSFVNIYLSPADYHHVHVPFNAKVLSTKFMPGKLWPVTGWALNTVKDLYSENARTVTMLDKEGAVWCLVMVAAFNVGQIKLHYLNSTSSDRAAPEDIQLERAQMFGSFLLGSSVLLFSPDRSLDRSDLCPEKIVQVNQSLTDY